MDRDDQIRYNLECYLPYVRECADASHLLMNLDCYSSAERSELNKLTRRDPGEATRRAFEILLKKDSPGLFSSLLHSFEQDYPKIFKLLQGDIVECDANYRHILDIFTRQIINQVQPDELALYLRHYGVITDVEAEETRAELKNHGPIRAAYFLVTNIHKHIEDWFKYFITALIDTGCEDLAESLDEDVVKKIRIQRNHEFANVTYNAESLDDMKELDREEIHDVSRNSKAAYCSVAQRDANTIKVKTGISDSLTTDYNNQKEFCDVKVLHVKTDTTENPEQMQSSSQSIENTDLEQAQNDVQMETSYDRTNQTNLRIPNFSRDSIEITDLKHVADQTHAIDDTDGDYQNVLGDVKVINSSRDTIGNTELKQAVHYCDAQKQTATYTSWNNCTIV